MKKYLAVLILTIFLFTPSAFARMNTWKLMDAQAIAGSGNAVTYTPSTGAGTEIDLQKYDVEGFFSIQVLVADPGSNDPTVTFEYELSNDGTNYLEPSSASDIAVSLAEAGGPGSDGRNIYSFQPEPARYIRIKATETAGDNVTVTVWLMVR